MARDRTNPAAPHGLSTDGPTPAPCDPEIFQRGQPVVLLDARSNAAESWVQAVAKMANARVDWHYSGGVAQVLHLGDAESRARVENAIDELAPTLKGTILRRYEPEDTGLYRNGVTQAPEGAIASFMDPITGEAAYMVAEPEPK